MTTTLPLRIPHPDWTLVDELPGGWAKRGSVPASRMPRIDGHQHPCPTNGHLSRGRGLTCTHHQPGQHVAASLGRVLAVWPDVTVQHRTSIGNAYPLGWLGFCSCGYRCGPGASGAVHLTLDGHLAEVGAPLTARDRVNADRADSGGA